MTSPWSVFSLSSEKELELVNAPAILSFQASVNDFFAAASRNSYIFADMLPM
jgi:hypothetical protein